MKQKCNKKLKISESYYNKKHNIELNNKVKKPKLKNTKSAINNLNIICSSANETKTKNNMTNIPFRTKLIKAISNNERNNNNEINKIQYYKKKIYDKPKSEFSEELEGSETKMYIENESTGGKDNPKKDCIESYNETNDENNQMLMNKENIRINQSMTPIKTFKNEGNNKNNQQNNNLKKNPRFKLNIKNSNKMNSFNKTVNELDYKKMEKNLFNLKNIKNKKGTFSFYTFFKKKNDLNKDDKEINEQDNEFETERNYFNNKFKERTCNNSFKKKDCLHITKNDNLNNNTFNDFKNNNNNNNNNYFIKFSK